MSASVRLDHADSLHPTIHLRFPHDFLSTLTADQCKPAVLLRLPPALFLDPHTFPVSRPSSSVQIDSLRHLNSSHPSLASYDFTKVEIESGVGYSNPRAGAETNTAEAEERTRPVRPRGQQVKRVGDSFIVASSEDVGSRVRYQDEHADANAPLAKEHRAVLLTLRQDKQGARNKSRKEDAEYDDLTGLRAEQEEADDTVALDIPIHSRYVLPHATTLTREQLWRRTMLPSAGNYQQVFLDKPELLWMCKEVEYLLDSAVYDKVSYKDLLPSPHSHLSLHLTPHESKWNFYRYRMPLHETAFRLSLPAGDASLGPYVQLITFGLVVVAALWTAVQVQGALVGVRKVQAQWEKKQSPKAE